MTYKLLVMQPDGLVVIVHVQEDHIAVAVTVQQLIICRGEVLFLKKIQISNSQMQGNVEFSFVISQVRLYDLHGGTGEHPNLCE